MENISGLDNVVEFILRTENFSPDDIEEALLFGNCTGQTIGSTKFTNSDTHKNEFNNMTKAVMESMPHEDVLLYSADILSEPSFSSNYKKMDQGQQINQEPFDPTDSFEFSDEEFRQMINLRDSFEVQEEVVTEECPEQDIYIQSLDKKYSTDFDPILETEVQYNMSSTVDVDIPILEGERASYSVNPYSFSRFNQKPHVINHMLTNHTEHSFCCVLCSNHYHQISSPNNVLDSLQFTVPIHSLSVTNGKSYENKDDILYQEPNTKKGYSRGKSRIKKKDPTVALKFYSKPHTCNPCGLSFTYKNVLLKHARLHHNHDGVNIVSTQKSDSNSYELTILANSKFNDVYHYYCDLCEAVYNRFDFFKRHQRLHINIELGIIEGETNRCIDSGLLLNSLPELEMHPKQHLIVTSFPKKSKCSVCFGQFGVTDEVSDLDRSQLHSDSLTEFVCRLCRNQSNGDKVLQKNLIIHDTSDDNVNKNDKGVTCDILDEEVADKRALINHKASHVNTISAPQNSSTIKMFPCDSSDKVGTFKDQRHSQLGDQKNTCCLVPNYMARQFDTEQVSYGSKYTDLKSELKDGECTRTCSTVLYYTSRSDSTIMNSSLAEESKKNVILTEPDNQISVNYKDLTHTEKKNEQLEFVVQDYNKISNINYTKVKRKYQRRSKSGNQENTCYLVSDAMAGQFDTDICEDESVLTDDEQYIQSIINEDEMRYNPMSIASASKSQAKKFKIINGKLQKNKQKSSEQESPESKHTVLKSENVPKKQSFVLKDGQCTRTCSTVPYYSSRSYSNVMNSSLSEESKENDSLIEPEDQQTIE